MKALFPPVSVSKPMPNRVSMTLAVAASPDAPADVFAPAERR